MDLSKYREGRDSLKNSGLKRLKETISIGFYGGVGVRGGGWGGGGFAARGRKIFFLQEYPTL